MKRLFLLLIAILITLTFSCASKESAEDLSEIQAPVEENVFTEENVLTEENSNNPQNTIELENQTNQEKEVETLLTNQEDSAQEQEAETLLTNQEDSAQEKEAVTLLEDNSIENSNKEVEVIEDFPPLEDIEEPLVIDLEAPEEIVENIENIEKAEELTIEELEEIQPDFQENQEIIDNNLPNSENKEEIIEDKTTSQDSLADVETTPKKLDDDGVEFLDLDPNNIVLEISDTKENDFEVNEEKEIKPSRSITLKKLEYLDVTYPGKGWIYMGLTDNSKDITYFGRKILPDDTKFSLQAKIEGKKILHFYKEDSLTGEYIDDYIEVIVEKEKGSSKTHIEAPKYIPQIKKESKKIKKSEVSSNTNEIQSLESAKNESAKKEAASDNNSKSSVKVNEGKTEQNNSQNIVDDQTTIVKENKKITEIIDQSSNKAEIVTESITEENKEIDSSKLYEDAINYYNLKQYQAALNSIVLYLQNALDKRDAALYLQGQIYEADSEIQNINKAIDSYTMLTNNFPASSYWEDANKRIIYLKRFYLEGR